MRQQAASPPRRPLAKEQTRTLAGQGQAGAPPDGGSATGHQTVRNWSRCSYTLRMASAKLVRGRVQVGQDREGARRQDAGSGSRIGVGRGDDFVAGPDAESLHAGVQGLGARAGGDAKPRAQQPCILLLERGNGAGGGLDAAPNPAPGGPHHSLHDLFIHVRPGWPGFVLSHRFASPEGQLAGLPGDVCVGGQGG